MGTFVSGEGPSRTRVMLVGQNPGAKEAKKGRPFVGRAGKYLDKVLRDNHIDRKKLYITSVVKETTPGNRKPTAQEVNYWMPHLLEEIKRVKPGIVVLMGQVAQKTPRFEGIKYVETYHPAAAMRFPKVREKFEDDFKELKKDVE